MKLAIEKLSTGAVRLTLQTASDKKPVSVELARQHVLAVADLLRAADKAQSFTFTVDL